MSVKPNTVFLELLFFLNVYLLRSVREKNETATPWNQTAELRGLSSLEPSADPRRPSPTRGDGWWNQIGSNQEKEV